MEVKAIARNVDVAPRKLRLLSYVFKNELAADAIGRLAYTKKAGAPVIAKAIKSAVASAALKQMNVDVIKVKNIIVEQGVALKRFRPVAKGMAHSYKKRTSHLTVILED